jgi:VWFA-related protein
MALAVKASFVLILVICLLSAPSRSQQPQPRPPNSPLGSATPPQKQDEDVVRINSNLVQIDAVVTDKEGHQVSDLSASDFEIVEEGRTIAPEFFSYVRLGSIVTEKNTSGQPTADALRRVFVFVISNPVIEFAFSSPGPAGGPPSSGSFTTQARAQRAADAARSLLTWFVDTQMADADLTAIADTDADLGVLASFTSDRDVLHEAIKEVRDNSGKSPTIRVFASGGDITLQPLVKQNLRMLETLENVVDQVEKLPGRKVVTFVARGMLYNPYLPYAEVIRDRVEKLIARANRAQIAIYTLQLRDLSPGGGNYGNDGLIHVARETGGKAIYNTNDLRVGFAEIVEENRGYYLLAYNPGAEAVARPHRLQVRVKRQGLKVLSRSEAYAARPKTSVATAANAVDLPYASGEIKVTLTPSMKAGGPTRQILTSWNVDLHDVASAPGADHTNAFSLTLSVRVVGPSGRILKQADRDVAFEVKDAEVEGARREGLDSKFEIDAPKPGFYRFSVAVRDNTSGRIGSATRFLEIKKP